MTIDWANLTPSEFEELCYSLAEANGFVELRWYGKGGGDKGRDILAKKEIAYTERTRILESWIIQSKRYTVQPPGIPQISSFFEQCREHKPDNVLIIISNTLSADTKDWIDSVKQDYKFRIHIWEEMDLIHEMKSHRSFLSPKCADLLKQMVLPISVPVHFFPAQIPPTHYMIDANEFEELGIFIINDYGYKRNMEYIRAFIEYLRNHNVAFDIDDDDDTNA